MLDYVKTISEQPTTGVVADLPSSGSTPSDLQTTEQPEQPVAEGEKNKGNRPTQIGYAWHVYVLAAYYILFFLFLFWCLIDVWSGQLRALTFITGVLPHQGMDRSMLVEISFAAIGGFGGSIEYHIKRLFHFYTKGEYDPRHFAKYLTAPFEGAVLAVIVLSLIRGGITMLSGTGTPAETGTPTVAAFAALAIGALVGFGMREVVSWLLALIQTMFAQQTKQHEESEKNIA